MIDLISDCNFLILLLDFFALKVGASPTSMLLAAGLFAGFIG